MDQWRAAPPSGKRHSLTREHNFLAITSLGSRKWKEWMTELKVQECFWLSPEQNSRDHISTLNFCTSTRPLVCQITAPVCLFMYITNANICPSTRYVYKKFNTGRRLQTWEDPRIKNPGVTPESSIKLLTMKMREAAKKLTRKSLQAVLPAHKANGCSPHADKWGPDLR